jgi:hypothetical protein
MCAIDEEQQEIDHEIQQTLAIMPSFVDGGGGQLKVIFLSIIMN